MSRRVFDANGHPCVQSTTRSSSQVLSRFVLAVHTMDGDEGWNTFLHDHPIFASAKDSGASASGAGKDERRSLELSLKTLPDFTNQDTEDIRPVRSGRRQIMVIKDSDMIVAVGSEIRMASLGDAKLNKGQSKTYKVRTFSHGSQNYPNY